jgi:hypothetical protein
MEVRTAFLLRSPTRSGLDTHLLVGSEEYQALLLINAIRNTFAHSLHKVDFDHELVAKDCEQLAALSDPLARALGLAPHADEPPIEIFSKMVSHLYFSMRLSIQKWGNNSASRAPIRHDKSSA